MCDDDYKSKASQCLLVSVLNFSSQATMSAFMAGVMIGEITFSCQNDRTLLCLPLCTGWYKLFVIFCFEGAFILGKLADQNGRKTCLLITITGKALRWNLLLY